MRLEAGRVRRFDIHAETRDIPNTVTGKSAAWVDLYHAVVKGTKPDENGELHPVCDENVIVDLESWGRFLRDWPDDPKRCEVCYRAVRDEIEAQIKREGSTDWNY
jgi:hypothetical protein